MTLKGFNDDESPNLVVVLEEPDIVGVAEGEGIEEVPEVGRLVLDGLPGHLQGWKVRHGRKLTPREPYRENF